MSSFGQQFGKRGRFRCNVRAKCVPSSKRTSLVLEFAFSPEVVAVAGWASKMCLDVAREGDTLTFAPSETGRALHGQPATVKFGFDKARLKSMEKWFGFPLSQVTVWHDYTVDGDRITVRLPTASSVQRGPYGL